MGTRGLYGFRKNGVDKTTYNHWDSYPAWLGKNVLNFIKGHTVEELNNIYDKIIMVDSTDEPSQEDITKYEKYADLSVSNKSYKDWYCLLRGCQGDLEPYGEDLEHMIKDEDFIKDSLSCEHAYIINLDTLELEYFQGFQETPDPSNRYGCEKDKYGYYPCRLMYKIKLEDIDIYEDVDEIIKRMENASKEVVPLKYTGIVTKDDYKIFVNLAGDYNGNTLISYKGYRPYSNQVFGFAKPNSNIIYTDMDFNQEYVFGVDRDIRDELIANGYELVYITGFIGNKIKEIVDRELRDYIMENLNNSDFVFEKIKDNNEIWLNTIIEEYDRYENFEYQNASYFVVKNDYTTENYASGIKDLSFDFKTMSFNLSDKEIFERAILTTEKYVPLLKRQIELGIAATVAAKCVELNKFFHDKKSINVVLKNGMTIKDNLTWNNKIYINNQNEVCYSMSYYSKPRTDNLKITEIDYFKYQNKIFQINSEEFIINLDK